MAKTGLEQQILIADFKMYWIIYIQVLVDRF